jgi:hypothetical protein
MLTRFEWAESRRLQTLEQTHCRRHESYGSGSWSPVLSKMG